MSSVLAVTPDDSTPACEQLRRQLVDLIEGDSSWRVSDSRRYDSSPATLGSLWAPLPGRITSSKPPAWADVAAGPGGRWASALIVDVIEMIEVAEGLSAFLRSGHAETPCMTRRDSNHQPRRVLPTRVSAASH
jgi:hypothetical protein